MASIEKLQIPAWFFGIASLLFVLLLIVSFFTGRQLSWSPFGYVKQSSTDSTNSKIDSGFKSFSSKSTNCGTFQKPCVIHFEDIFSEKPNCVLTAWNSDESSYSENPVIKSIHLDQMEIWRGANDQGTSINVSWICTGK